LFHRVRLLRAQRTIPNTPFYRSAFAPEIKIANIRVLSSK
jgi:hypothetical protein